MSVVVIGLNHRTVPLDLLERMTVSDAHLPKALGDLVAREHVSEAVVLSTCNRTEVYASAERFHGAYHDIREWFSELAFLPPEEFTEHLYVHEGAAAVNHLFEVAAGIDSAVLGETEILGQVRRAWERAHDEGTVGAALNLLFRHAVEVGKRARTETSISRHVTSVSQAAVALAADHVGGLDDRRVLVLGAGEMGEGIVAALGGLGTSRLQVANRTWERSLDLAERVGGTAVPLAELADAMVDADVVLTSTGASTLMIEHADLEPVVALRTSPLLIVDVAVPRDVDPAAADLPGITLLDMTDIQAFAERGLAGRRREVAAVHRLLDDEVERFLAVSTAREAAPLVADLRARADEIRTAELDRFSARLESLSADGRATVEALSRGIVAKLLHGPTVELKDAAGSPRGERLAEALRELFDL